MDWRFPQITLNWLPIWKRNLHVWRKLLGAAVIGNFGEPLLYLVVLGYGLGSFVGRVQGMDYMTFLASGIVCSSAMNTASLESLFSAYTRMAVQHTWEGMLMTPLQLDDIVLGEIIWSGTKSLISSTAIFLVAAMLGAVHGWTSLWVLPVMFLTGLSFSSISMITTSVSRSYDFFTYYFTLFITPMFLLSGVFFPLKSMPMIIQWGAQILPLTHAVEVARPLMTGGVASNVVIHLGVLVIYTIIGLYLSVVLLRRRILV